MKNGEQTTGSMWDNVIAADTWWKNLGDDKKLYWANRLLELNTTELTNKQLVRLHHKWLKLNKTK